MRRLGLVFVALIAWAASALAASPLDELRRAFMLDGKPIPPDVFRDFGDADLGNSLPAVVTIDVKAAIKSERYGFPIARRGDLGDAEPAGDRLAQRRRGEQLSLRRRDEERVARRRRDVQRRRQRIFTTLHVLDASLAAGFDGDGKRYGRVDLTVLRSVVLGDRWQGEAAIAGETVRIATTKTPAEGIPKTIEAKRP